MKSVFNKLNRTFESRTRLGIMSVLSVHNVLDFNALKTFLELTDGNLASHLKALEKAQFIGVEKSFILRKPNTRYFITKLGKKAFQQHLSLLEKLIQTQRKN